MGGGGELKYLYTTVIGDKRRSDGPLGSDVDLPKRSTLKTKFA